MKALIVLLIMFLALPSFADNRKRERYNPSLFDVVAINSPVKESVAKFLLKTPNGFEIDELRYKIKNSTRLFEKEKSYEVGKLISGSNGKELHISISKLTPGFYQLYVFVKDRKSKKEHEFKTKFKDHAAFVIDSSLEVPVPNETENNKTVAGIDSDKDGIRDDVQRWINESYSTQIDTKMAVKQIAMSYQLGLLRVNDKNQSILASQKFLDSNNCLSAVVGAEKSIKMISEIQSKFLNTKDRHYADIKSNSNFSGQAIDLPSAADEALSCDFDLSTK